MMMRYCCVVCLVALATVSPAPDRAFSQTPGPWSLQLETKIPLGDVKGRIDHMAIDLPRRRLFVAELGNDTVGVVDLNEQKVRHVITGLKEPQGLGYVPSSDTLFVANAADGSVAARIERTATVAATSTAKARLAGLEETALPTMGDFFEHIVSFDQLAKRRVLMVELTRVAVADEELASGGVRIRGTSHRDDTPIMVPITPCAGLCAD